MNESSDEENEAVTYTQIDGSQSFTTQSKAKKIIKLFSIHFLSSNFNYLI